MATSPNPYEIGLDKDSANYAPMTPHVPSEVTIRHIDPVLAMQSMTFHIKRDPWGPGK